MSTRGVVIIHSPELGKEYDIVLYHHHDCYPEGVGADLKARLAKYKKEQYWEIIDIVNKLVKDIDDEYEITTYIHTDIEYLYLINCTNKTLKCFKVRGDWKEYEDIIKYENEISLDNVKPLNEPPEEKSFEQLTQEEKDFVIAFFAKLGRYNLSINRPLFVEHVLLSRADKNEIIMSALDMYKNLQIIKRR